MRALTVQEIEQLASRPKVRRIAVENFLMSMGNDTSIAKVNLMLDARMYKWNIETIQAIMDGINLAEGFCENDEVRRISAFLAKVSPIVIDFTKKILKSKDYEVIENGIGIDLVFFIKHKGKEVGFNFHNLFLEIATVDRDEEPLRFDEKLQDFDYFMNKMVHNVESKLRILFHLFGEEDVEKAIENITKDAKLYERIRILRVDPDKS